MKQLKTLIFIRFSITLGNLGIIYICGSVCHYVCDGVGCTGQALIGSEWALGSNHNYPEQNCCACGKIGAAQGKQFVKIVN